MATNVQHFGQSANIPAGIFSGTELFAHNGDMYAIYNGTSILFQDLPSMEKRNFIEVYMQDKEAQESGNNSGSPVLSPDLNNGFSASLVPWTETRTPSMDRSPLTSIIQHVSGQIVLVAEKYAAAI